jgi:hypothetical protein
MAGRKVARLSIFLLLGSVIFPQILTNRLRVPLYFNVKSGVGYDSNYLKLSNAEQDTVAYYPVLLGDSESVSTFISKTTFEVKYSPYLIEGHESKFRIKVNYKNYIESPNKSFSSFGVYFAQHLGKYEWVKLSYSYLPQYYLRDYRDKDIIIIDNIDPSSDQYLHSCFFSQGSTILTYSKWIGIRSWIEGMLAYNTQYYDSSFTEFDLNIIAIGIKLSSKDYKNYPVQINFIQSFANNVTFQNGLHTTRDMNRGYSQRFFSFKLSKNNMALTIIQELGVLFSNTYRKYSSEIESDVLHYNRNQNESKINVWIGGALNHSTGLRLDLINRSRDTFSVEKWVEELKSFKKTECFVTISYTFSSDILY